VINGMFRCAAIGDTRIWLDCYYGAAQPQRAALGMAPASAAQVNLGLSPPVGGERENPGLRDDVMASAGRCGSVGDEHQWLVCYYTAAVPVRALLGLSVPPSQSISQVMPAEARPAEARFAEPRPASGPRPHRTVFDDILGVRNFHLTSQMASYSFDQLGNFTVTLANGQVWRQREGDTPSAHWRKPAASYQVNITGGAFGSFNLTVKDSPFAYKVRRIS
jgi:hypothetical protein